MPGRYGQKRLHRKIELRTESSAHRGRYDTHSFRRNAKNCGDIIAIHIGRLRAGLNLDLIANSPCETGLGLDVPGKHQNRIVGPI